MLDLSSAYDVTSDGTIFSIGENRLRNLVWVDRQGRSSLLIETADRYGSPRLSPDGTRVAVETYIRDIWVIDVEQGSRIRLTLEMETGLNAAPVWTRDGTAVTFFGEHVEGGRGLFLAPADGRSPPEPILARDSRPIPGSWSPDGAVLAFHDVPRGEDRDIYLFTPSSGEPPEPFVASSFDENGPAFSPNGRWIAYVSDESGRDEVYVRAYPGPGAKVTVSTDGGIQPVWSPDGRELFYREADRMMVVDVDTGPRFTASKLRVLFQGRYLFGNINNPSYSVSPDGQRFVMIQDAQGTTPHFGVVLNWLEDVERANARDN